MTPVDVAGVLIANAVVLAGMWVRHGGLAQLTDPAGWFTATGQLTALIGTYVALVQLVLMSRAPWIDRVLGTDRIATWHRWLGFTCLWLLVGHAVFTTVGYALGDGSGVVEELWTFLTAYPWVLMATVGLVLLIAVAASSMRATRRRLSYETWYGIHLYAYLAIALAFLHELVVGTDFIDDQVAVGYWVALYVVAFAPLVWFRVLAPLALYLRHRPRVEHVAEEAPGVVSVYVSGRDLASMPVRAGQYFQVRFLNGGGWWRHHPFSISAAPNGSWLRLTVKALGDDTTRMTRLRPGTRVFLEGPYGTFTRERVEGVPTLFLAGGIGITPIRAMLEEDRAEPRDDVLVYRARSWPEVVFKRELDQLGQRPGIKVGYLVGRRGTKQMPVDPLSPQWLQHLVPDISRRTIFLCGSGSFMDRVLTSLDDLDIPREHIHAERFS
jgi:predicted ferric reductase